MPDKKVSEQIEHIVAVLGTDLMPMVGNVATGTPTNYKVQVKNFFSQIAIDLPQTTYSALKITASATANANAAIQAAAEFNLVANSSVGATALDRYGLVATNKIQNGNTTITGRIAAAMFTLDTGNSVTAAANTYGVIVSHATDSAVTTARLTAPRAFFAVMDDAGANAAAKTTYLMDIGAMGKLVSQDLAVPNVAVMFSLTTDRPATHVLKVNVGGMNLWLLASNTGPA